MWRIRVGACQPSRTPPSSSKSKFRSKNPAPADTTARIVQALWLGITDISGLHYDAVSDQLLVISDGTNPFHQVTRAGQILRSYALPGQNQEGVTVDPAGHIYIAQDSGGIHKSPSA